MCFYFDLLEIFGNRASAKPKVLSSGNLDMSEDEMSIRKSDDSDGSFSGLDSGGDYGLDSFSFDEESEKKKKGKRKTDVDDTVSGQRKKKRQGRLLPRNLQ